MAWYTTALIVTLCVAGLAIIFAAAYYLTKPADSSDGLQPQTLRFSHSQGVADEDEFMTEYDRQLANMSGDQLAAELNRLIHNGEAPDPTSQERDQRAFRLLNMLTSQAGNQQGEPQNIGEGDGIVICAGGFTYGTCGYLLVESLRRHGCTMPIEVWYRNSEMSSEMQKLFEDMDCTYRNIDQVTSVTLTNRFSIKPLAVYHSKFQRVLLLDADNLAVKDPTPLFSALSQTSPAIFWPDNWPLDQKAHCWNALTTNQQQKITYHYAQESGQLLVDKAHCMKALQLCGRININLHSQLDRLFPAPFNKGDKDTWHFSWLVTDTPFYMIKHRPGSVGQRDQTGQYFGTGMIQYDLESEAQFIHGCWNKWSHQAHKPMWTDTFRFLSKDGHVDQWTHRLEDGQVERHLFSDLFGDLEEHTWNALNALRNQEWYQELYREELASVN